MGNPRRRPQLLAEKLLLIRKHLNVSQSAMREMLNLSNRTRVSQYENGKRVPDLIVTLAYARIGKIPIASLADDDVSVDALRKQLGKFKREVPRRQLAKSNRKLSVAAPAKDKVTRR
jgi:transcriptional regulator with XRE-family HTH domain